MEPVNVIEQGSVVKPHLQRKPALSRNLNLIAVEAPEVTTTATATEEVAAATTATATEELVAATTATATEDVAAAATETATEEEVAAATTETATEEDIGLTGLLKELADIHLEELCLDERLNHSLMKVKDHLEKFVLTDEFKNYVRECYNCYLYNALFQLLPSCGSFLNNVGLGIYTFLTEDKVDNVKNRFRNVNQDDGYTKLKTRYYLKDDASFKSHVYNMVVLSEGKTAKDNTLKIRKTIQKKISGKLTMVTTFLFSETDDDYWSDIGNTVEFVVNNNNNNDSSVSNNNDTNNDNNNNNDDNDNDNDNDDDDNDDDDDHAPRWGRSCSWPR